MCPHKIDVNLKFDLSAIQHIAQHRRLAIEECIEALTHSCLCNDAYCRRPSCTKMKRVVIHTSICKRRIKGNCPICKQLIALCCYHAKHCRKARCSVPFCNTVKAKMRQQNLLFDPRLDAARDQLRMQPDPDESDAIDVNMSGSPPFGDDSPSSSRQSPSHASHAAASGSGAHASHAEANGSGAHSSHDEASGSGAHSSYDRASGSGASSSYDGASGSGGHSSYDEARASGAHSSYDEARGSGAHSDNDEARGNGAHSSHAEANGIGARRLARVSDSSDSDDEAGPSTVKRSRPNPPSPQEPSSDSSGPLQDERPLN